MKTRKWVFKTIIAVSILAFILAIIGFVSNIGIFQSKLHSLKGRLIGVSYTADFYDNSGERFFSTTGEKIDIDGNIVKELSVDSAGNTITNYTLSSVITITIDGHQMESCGNTVIFAEKGLNPDVDFSLSDIESEANGITSLTSAAKVVNKYKNAFGKPQVVVIQSQLGVPICAFSGKDVTWEIPNDLPKTTKLMIDGKALYVHRANFEIIDKNLFK